MPLAEIPWRVWEKIKKQQDKSKKFISPEISLMPKSTVFLLSRYAEPEYLYAYFSQSIENHLSIADVTLKNYFSVFGINLDYGTNINWHTDPVTRKQWPKKFWGDINYRNENLGGVKFVWEINRLYFLFSLAISYRLTKDKKYADKIIKLVKSWLRGNPYPIGINWASGIEAGIRLANLIWALSFLDDYNFSKDDLKAINSFVWFHANHLERYPSKFSSSNNHLIAEAFGLFLSGLYFPHLNKAAKWFNKGKNILETEIVRQILPDGGSFEYSTTYLSFVLDFFLLFKISCDANGIKYAKNVDKRIEKSCEFILSIMDKNKNIPNIGDQDSAVLVGFGVSNKDNFSSILSTCSLLYNRNDFTADIHDFDFKTYILTGYTHFPEQTRLHSEQRKQKNDRRDNIGTFIKQSNQENRWKKEPFCHIYRQSGLAVIRDYVEEKEILFVGNAMPLGMAPLYAHGHLDALSFTLSVDGLEIFIDPGTYLYHSGKKWRTYFRSTAAHNTIRINKTDMSEQTGDFMFGKPYKIIMNTLEKKNDNIIWTASHDAYLRKKPFASVMREVTWNTNKKQFIIMDSIKQNKHTFIELFFHCHPECRVGCSVSDIDNNCKQFIIKKNNTVIKLLPEIFMDCEILYGSYNPVSGWYSPSFNQIMKTSTIRCAMNVNGDIKIKTKITINSTIK